VKEYRMARTFYMKETSMLFIKYTMIVSALLFLFVIALPIFAILAGFYLVILLGALIA
jgi:hypothetical protein